MTTHYLSKARYDELVRQLLDPHQADSLDRENAIKIILGEAGDVWPVTIQPETDGQS